MPELPEVEAARLMLSRHLQGSRVVSVNPLESGGGPRSGLFDEKCLSVGTPAALAAALVGRVLSSVGRRGKQMWLTFAGKGPHVMAHLGMTGSFAVLPPGAKRAAVSKYIAVSVDDDAKAWPPRFSKMEIVMSSGARAVFVDPRRFGRVYLDADPENSERVKALGVDPILDWEKLPLASFEAALSSRAMPIKSWLLEQGTIAGIGNWIADEALHSARIHPETVSSALSTDEAARLHSAIKEICDAAVKVEAVSERFPKEWLFHARWGKGKGPGKMADGAAVSWVTVGGRTSAFVPSRQGRPRKTPAAKRAREEEGGEEEAAGGAPAAAGRSSSAGASSSSSSGGQRSSSSAAAASSSASSGGRRPSSSAAAASSASSGGRRSSSSAAAASSASSSGRRPSSSTGAASSSASSSGRRSSSSAAASSSSSSGGGASAAAPTMGKSAAKRKRV